MRDATARRYEMRIERVLRHVAENLDAPLELDDLARVAAFSPFHFHRIFRGVTGESVGELVRRFRLERAALALRAGERSVTEIAFDAGYESAEAFSRAFRRCAGVSPSAYRSLWPPPVLGRREARARFRPADGHVELDPVDGGTAMEVRIEERPATRIAYVRHIGPYHEIGPAFERVVAWAAGRGLLNGPPQCMSRSYDDPESVPAAALRSDACVPIGDAPVTPEEAIEVDEIAAGRYAVYTHVGPYDGIGAAYQRLFGAWLPGSGESLADHPCLERYLNDASRTSPDALRTELCVPLARRG